MPPTHTSEAVPVRLWLRVSVNRWLHQCGWTRQRAKSNLLHWSEDWRREEFRAAMNLNAETKRQKHWSHLKKANCRPTVRCRDELRPKCGTTVPGQDSIIERPKITAPLVHFCALLPTCLWKKKRRKKLLAMMMMMMMMSSSSSCSHPQFHGMCTPLHAKPENGEPHVDSSFTVRTTKTRTAANALLNTCRSPRQSYQNDVQKQEERLFGTIVEIIFLNHKLIRLQTMIPFKLMIRAKHWQRFVKHDLAFDEEKKKTKDQQNTSLT